MVRVLLEIVPPAVRYDAAAQDMYLADRPRVEARFGEDVLEDVGVPNLQISDAGSEAVDTGTVGNCSQVVMVENPADRVQAIAYCRDLKRFEIGAHISRPLSGFEIRCEWSGNGIGGSVDVNIVRFTGIEFVKELLNVPPEPEAG